MATVSIMQLLSPFDGQNEKQPNHVNTIEWCREILRKINCPLTIANFCYETNKNNPTLKKYAGHLNSFSNCEPSEGNITK